MTQFFRKIYLSLYLKGFERVTKGFTVRGRRNRTATYWPPRHNSVFPVLLGSSSGAWGPSLPGTWSSFQHLLSNWSELQLLNRGLRAPSAGCWFSLPQLISNWLNFLSPELYNNLTSTLLPASVTISHSIQPLDSQSHILIFLDRMHLLFTQVHFLFWQLGRVGGQYTTFLFIFSEVVCNLKTVSVVWIRVLSTWHVRWCGSSSNNGREIN